MSDWDAADMVRRCMDYGLAVWSTPEVSRHERIYATGIVVAALIAAAAATAVDAHGRLLRVLTLLPHPNPRHGDNDMDELRHGLLKGHELMNLGTEWSKR